MTRTLLIWFSGSIGVLGVGCSSDGGSPGGNPAVLWLDIDMVETQVHLIDQEPQPY